MTTHPSRKGAAGAVPETFTLTADNGEPIVVERRTATGVARSAVLIVPAMATRARYYAPLADWLAGQGHAVYTFDYQGYGASARTPLRDVDADILTWAGDAATVLTWVHEDAAGLPVTWLGHSLGGQLLPFTPHHLLNRAVIVASGTGYWRHSEGANRILAPALWYGIAPALTRLFGYYPGRRIKLLGDLPTPVMRQWASWCKQPDYLFGVLREHRNTFAAVTLPLTSLSFTDDATMSTAATEQLESFYTGADLTRLRLTPAELGRTAVGHMGFFHRGNEQLWEKVLTQVIETTD